MSAFVTIHDDKPPIAVGSEAELIAVLNSAADEASSRGMLAADRRELMSQLRSSPLTMGRVYTRESDRCKSFDEEIKAAERCFQRLASQIDFAIRESRM